MQNIYFTSDTHWGHKNIVKSISKWADKSGCRNFDSIEEHDSTIIENINLLVKKDDILYHLGDWSFGETENIKKYRNQIKCKNIHLVLGNHDKYIRPIDSPFRGCFSSVNDIMNITTRMEKDFLKTKFFLSHYGHRVWPNSHHNSIHLYGHSHGTLPRWGRSMDVGIDCNNFYPFHLDEILFEMKNVEPLIIDHHTTETT